MFLLLITLLTAAAEPDAFEWAVPEPPSPVPLECSQAVDLIVGRPVPTELLDEQGMVKCYATVMPTSGLAGLLLVESWALRAEPRGARAALQLSWERERYVALSDAFDKPTPWLQRPATQRTIGHLEAVGVLILAIGVYAVLDGQVIP